MESWGVGVTDAQPRGSDWVVWQEDRDGLIEAEFVFHPETGLLEGDILHRLDDQQYNTLDDLRSALDRIPVGTTHTYTVLRGAQPREIVVDVYFGRPPFFLYPLSRPLWQFSFWGYCVISFSACIALLLSGPFVLRSRRAWVIPSIIAVAGLWYIGNLLRITLVHLVPPIPAGGNADVAFQAITLISLIGWSSYPALMLHYLMSDSECPDFPQWHWIIYVPSGILISVVTLVTIRGAVGPITIESLLWPLRFYICWYIGLIAWFVMFMRFEEQPAADGYRYKALRIFAAILVVLTALVGLSLLGIVPLFDTISDLAAGWIWVVLQLGTILPVWAVSLVYLKYGKFDFVLRRSLIFVTALGFYGLSFGGGLSLMMPYLPGEHVTRRIIIALYAVLLLVVLERAIYKLRVYLDHVLATDRQQAHRQLTKYFERMQSCLDLDRLARETIIIVCRELRSQSGCLFLCPNGHTVGWTLGQYGDAALQLSGHEIKEVWPYLQREAAIWTNIDALNAREPDPALTHFLRRAKICLAVPIRVDANPLGLLLLGPRKKGTVYNLEDVDIVKVLTSQLALVVERLDLFERECELERAGAEARLRALRSRINPHFLFNTLNAISSHVVDNPEEAENVVEHLAAIFRHTIQMEEHELLPLSEEIRLLSHYLSIEQARFGSRLTIHCSMDDTLRSVPVPAFAVQTLVENAINHGIRKKWEGGSLRLTCHRCSTDLAEVVVADTGVGIPDLFGKGQVTAAGASFLGIGLRNVAAKLKRFYGRSDLLRFESCPESGTAVRLLLPLNPAT